jgi:hypothetical protein
MVNMTQAQFNDKLVDILGGDRFLLSDMIDQDDLFSMQDSLAQLIVEAYNNGNVPAAKTWVRKCPVTFKIEK